MTAATPSHDPAPADDAGNAGDCSVREAVEADLPAVLALYRELYPELDLRLDGPVRRAWSSTLAFPGRAVLVAEVGGEPVGTLDATVVPNAARAGRPSLLVENVVVAAGHRRRGVGTALLAAARRRGREAGCYKLQLSAEDPAAVRFYETAGLRPAGVTLKSYLDEG